MQTGLLKTLASIGFLLLFPGFYFYHLMVAYGAPALLGGYFTISAIAVLAVLLGANFFLKEFSLKNNYYTYFFFSYLFYVLVVSLAKYGVSSGEDAKIFLEQVLKAHVGILALYFVGVHLEIGRRQLYLATLLSSLVVIAHLLLHMISTGSFSFVAKWASLSVEDRDLIATHQSFARSALVMFFLLICTTRKWWIEVLSVLSGMYVLFMLGSRSELVGFLFAYSGYLAVRAGRSPKQITAYALILMTSLVGLTAYLIKNPSVEIKNRNMSLLSVQSDKSALSRIEIYDDGLERINEYPFWGGNSGHVREGESSRYIHNFLSSWESFGIPGLLLYCLLLIIPSVIVVKRALVLRRVEPLDVILLLFALMVPFLAVVSKSVYWVLPGLYFGLFSQYLSKVQSINGASR